MQLNDIQKHISDNGLLVRGGYNTTDDDDLPAIVDKTGNKGSARALVMIGNAGPAMWRSFIDSYEYQDGMPDPLDRWTRKVITKVAEVLDTGVVFPFDGPPWWPFQRWCAQCEKLSVSPLGILMHAEYGLWHALRAALLFDHSLDELNDFIGSTDEQKGIACQSCEQRICLASCPVSAYSTKGYNTGRCIAHIQSEDNCLKRGCLARQACPEAVKHRYDTEEEIFHLQAFRINYPRKIS